MKRDNDEGPSNRPLLESEINPISDDEGLEQVVASSETKNSEENESLEEVKIPSDGSFPDDEALYINVRSVGHPTMLSDEPSEDVERELSYEVYFLNSLFSGIRRARSFCRKPRPLNLLDEFEVVGGIPAVVIKNEKNKEDFDGFVFSTDGSRMAVSYIQGIVK